MLGTREDRIGGQETESQGEVIDPPEGARTSWPISRKERGEVGAMQRAERVVVVEGNRSRRGGVQGVRFELTNSYETRTSTWRL